MTEGAGEDAGGVTAPEAGVSFILVSHLGDWCFNPHRTEPLTIELGAPKVRLTIRARNAAFDKLECEAACTLVTTPECASFVAGLAAGRYLVLPGAPVALPVTVRGEERIDAAGEIINKRMIPFELLPPAVQELWRAAHGLLLDTQERFLRLLRWSQDVDSPPYLYEAPPSLFWKATSVEGDDHRGALGPAENSGAIAGRGPRGIRGIVWEEATSSAALAQLWNSGAAEPLAHELLREARLLLQSGALRSSLLMAATAVETGAKEHISKLRPHTQWILMNAPSPPVAKILRKYLPEMHSLSPLVADWSVLGPLWKACDKLVEARNDTAHAGAEVNGDAVGQHVETAADVLYFLDALAGHDWARRRVSTQLRDALSWPPPTEARITSTIRNSTWEIDKPKRKRC